ncbi:hypothetical protein K503DRAFT_802991 [Rhizopogon vinicolor AM-OR11-026]|uniref:Uncharacterized protein n=1 Tax=Rhizopogon vinicolor AM-OR11-026 TaxID=1314800 RepID=A0A1B7MRI4_9AGAM|nr:hypothetical protein K503DRAFT_802991 [Rhizopogon vinicolor AM-OR11-026]
MRDPQQHVLLRHLRKFLRSSSLTEAVPPVLNEQPRDPLDSQRTPGSPAVSSATPPSTFKTHISNWWPIHAHHALLPIVYCNAAAGAPKNNKDAVPKEYFNDSPPNSNTQQPTATAAIDAGEHVPEDTPTRTMDQRRAHLEKLRLKRLRSKLAALTNPSSLRGVARRSPRLPANGNVKLEVEGGRLWKWQPGDGPEARGVLLAFG